MSEECFEDVWHEMDFNGTGCITWHQVKPFILRAGIHEDELAEERRLAEEERKRQEAEKKRKAAEAEAARIAEEERLAREEAGEDD
jgi:hypothetical protein